MSKPLFAGLSLEIASRRAQLIAYFLFGAIFVWALLQPMDSTSVFMGDAQPQNLGWLLLALLVSFSRISTRQPKALQSKSLILMCLMIGWMLIVTVNAGFSCNPRTGWNGFWHMVGLFAFFYAARELLSDCRLRSKFFILLMSGGTALSIIGFHQVLIEFPEQRAEYQRSPETMLAELGIEVHEGSPQRARFESRLGSPEPLATFALTNSLAVLLSASLISALSLLILHLRSLNFVSNAGEPKERQRKGKPAGSNPVGSSSSKMQLRTTVFQTGFPRMGPGGWACIVMIGLVGTIWILTRSRIAYASVALVFSCWGIWELLSPMRTRTIQGRWYVRYPKSVLVALSLILLVAVGLAGKSLQEWSLVSGALQSLMFRIEYWIATVQMIGEHGLLGVGLGNFQSYYPRYMLATASETVADPHNWILDLAITCSVPFAVVAVAVVIRMLLVRSSEKNSQVSRLIEDARWRGGKNKRIDTKDAFLPADSYFVAGAAVGALAVLIFLALLGMQIIVPLGACLIAGILAVPLTPVAGKVFQVTHMPATLAAVSMLLCLFVSGSWQASGIAIPLICLICCQLPSSPQNPTQESASPQSQRLTEWSWKSATPAFVFLFLLVVFLWQSWNPVLRSSAAALRQPSSLSDHLQAVEEARRLDPLNAQWDRFRIELLSRQLSQSSDAERVKQITEEMATALDEWTAREPISFLTWQFAGERALDMASAVERVGLANQDYLLLARNFFEKSVDAFPSQIQLRLQLSVSHALLGDLSGAEEQLKIAENLDMITPHLDRKLESQIVWFPPLAKGLTAEERAHGSWSRAELVVNWIRSRLKG